MEDILLVHRKSNRNFKEGLEENVAIWKTCLRQIVFCTEMDVNTWSDAFEKDDQILQGEKALSLLLEILCGLHSPIVGETEVFGQFRNFVESRKSQEDHLFSDHQKWLHFIMAEVKKTRSEHLVGLGSQSYGSLLRRHTKDLESATVCGSGHLAQEILPWLAHKNSLQVLCREPAKMQSVQEKFNNLTLHTYNDSYIHGEAMVIAAPLVDSRIMDLLSRTEKAPKAVFDLRGEDNQLASLMAEKFPHVTLMSLHQFFAEIEETKKDTHQKIEALKKVLFEKSLAFMQRTELRPLGWDDICA